MAVVREMFEGESVLVLDGGMGTLLMRAGLAQGAPPEEWNASHPDVLRKVHRDYVRAGARVILTNSFGGSPFRLRLHGLAERTVELNQAAGEVARDAAGGDGRILVAGAVGPSGEMLEPLGPLNGQAAEEGFAEQAAGLAAGGVDLIWVETMSDLAETRAAIRGARLACGLPIAATMTFSSGGRTVMGVTPEEAVAALLELGVVAVGANCGNGPGEIEGVIRRMASLEPPVPLIAKSNAGLPRWVETELTYDGTPEVMRAHALRVRELGARLIGGCCGTTPDHIRAMAEALTQG